MCVCECVRMCEGGKGRSENRLAFMGPQMHRPSYSMHTQATTVSNHPACMCVCVCVRTCESGKGRSGNTLAFMGPIIPGADVITHSIDLQHAYTVSNHPACVCVYL